MRNDAILIQTCFSTNPRGEYGHYAGTFYDMLRLVYPRHSAYARAHQMDYWHIMSDVHPEMEHGAWPKIWLMLDALEAGYQYVAYLDTDAVVWNMDCDLRDALPEGALIGACVHDPEKSAYLRACEVPRHHNVGVLYARNDPLTVQFLRDWLAAYPAPDRWQEQGVFNNLIEDERYAPYVATLDDTWNATVNVNMVNQPNVLAWHGIMPVEKRLDVMRGVLKEDFLKFRV
jgi:hypothetical protein